MKCDIYLENDVYYIEADIPGFNREDIKINYNRGNINIFVKEKNINDNKRYLLHERKQEAISRNFYFKNIDEELIEAKYENGVLFITIPKKEVKKNKIEIL